MKWGRANIVTSGLFYGETACQTKRDIASKFEAYLACNKQMKTKVKTRQDTDPECTCTLTRFDEAIATGHISIGLTNVGYLLSGGTGELNANLHQMTDIYLFF